MAAAKKTTKVPRAKAKAKAKGDEPKTYSATVELNTTKAPFAVHGKFLKASADYIKILGEVGDDIGSVIMVPIRMVKVIYLKEQS